MTRKEFYEKYGDYVVRFSHYYKFTFTYTAPLSDGITLSVSYGGNSDDIYRHEVSKDGQETVNSLQPYAGGIYKDGNEIEGFYDY